MGEPRLWKRDLSKAREGPTGTPSGSTAKHIQDTITSCTGPGWGTNRQGAAPRGEDLGVVVDTTLP